MYMREKINPLIKKQLEKCNVLGLNDIPEDTYTVVIPKIKTIKLEVGKNYIVKFDGSLLISSAFNNNWNRGIPPVSEYMLVDVTKIMSEMVKVNGIEYDYANQKSGTKVWVGWAPIQGIEILERV